MPPSDDGSSFEAWQGHTSFFAAVTLADPADRCAFRAAVRLYMLTPVVSGGLIETSHPTRNLRGAQELARADLDLVTLHYYFDGVVEGRSGDRAFRAGPGDVSFLDYRVPFDFVVSGFRAISLTYPRAVFPDVLRTRQIHGLVLSPDEPAARLLSTAVMGFHETLPLLTREQATSAALSLLHLVAAATDGVVSAPSVPRRPVQIGLFQAAQARIERDLGDANLSAHELGRKIGASRATLYRIFAPHGGVAAYIKERRLRTAYEILQADLRPADAIRSIAWSLGFPNEAHFSRAFSKRFGLSPREVRVRASRRTMPGLSAAIPGIAPATYGDLLR